MRNGSDKLDMAHSLTSYLGFGNLNSAALAYFTLIANSLVFSAMALPVLCGSEYPFAEKSVALGL